MFFYNLVVSLYHFGIRIAAFSNTKAAKWVAGRKSLMHRMESEIGDEDNLIWMHCASLGEFEQGRPIIERLKQQDSGLKFLITFFSPSGYEVRKDYEYASYVYYLPQDSGANAQKFLQIVKPRMAIFVKYEYWLNYLNQLKQLEIPTYLISARFREDQIFFKWYGGVFRKAIAALDKVFMQDETSQLLAKSIGLTNTVVSGDTRYDRVRETARNVVEVVGLDNFVKDETVFIGGSTWPVDEQFLLPYINRSSNKLKFILAPHEVDEQHIEEIERSLNVPFVRYSEINKGDAENARVLIIDNIGMLSNLYQYGHIAYVGGGFTGALHNILEPAAFGMPVIYGPKFNKFPEAAALIEAGAGFSITDGLDFIKRMAFLEDAFVVKIAAEVSRQFVKTQGGASDTIVNSIWK